MKKCKFLLFVIFFGIIVSSCTSVSYMSRSMDVYNKDASQVPVNAELKVNLEQKVTGTSDMQDSKKAAMESAYYNCITKNNIDIVVDPIVVMTKYSTFVSRSVKNAENAKWWIPQYKAEIIGYGGKYVKFENVEEQVKSYENINMDAVVKYKLVTDPSFHKSYYNSQKSSNNVFFNGENSTKGKKQVQYQPNPSMGAKLNTQPMSVSPISYSDMMKKGKDMRNAGIVLFSAGVALLAPIGAPIFTNLRHGFTAGICCMGIGAGLTIVGAGLWGGGSAKIKKAKNQNLSLDYNINTTGAQLAINF